MNISVDVYATIIGIFIGIVIYNSRCHHKWSSWKDIGNGELIRQSQYGEKIIGAFVEQRRYCEKCNKVKIRIAKS